jgi:hypothetical protein
MGFAMIIAIETAHDANQRHRGQGRLTATPLGEGITIQTAAELEIREKQIWGRCREFLPGVLSAGKGQQGMPLELEEVTDQLTMRRVILNQAKACWQKKCLSFLAFVSASSPEDAPV